MLLSVSYCPLLCAVRSWMCLKLGWVKTGELHCAKQQQSISGADFDSEDQHSSPGNDCLALQHTRPRSLSKPNERCPSANWPLAPRFHLFDTILACIYNILYQDVLSHWLVKFKTEPLYICMCSNRLHMIIICDFWVILNFLLVRLY